MSSLSDDTLRKIQAQAVASQRALTSVRAQVQSKEKERKILQLTMRELGALPREEGVYRSVGKMFVSQSRKDIDGEHTAQEKALSEEITNLTKKVRSLSRAEGGADGQAKYLEKQFDEANNQLKDISTTAAGGVNVWRFKVGRETPA